MSQTAYRTHHATEVTEQLVGQKVTLAGWVDRRRDHGGVAFIDLRDNTGLVQVVIYDEEMARPLRSEFVIQVVGEVRLRPDGNENEHLATGKIEVVAESIEVLAKSDALPFQVSTALENESENKLPGEDVRLKYRYLDLRRPSMQRNLKLRAQMSKAARHALEEMGFEEIETPTMIKSTPEGARDFVVPARLVPGSWYALPQSPQLLKQLLMVSGVERYYQLARCYRDEDFRADRQPEFTQLDIETSFMDEQAITELMEEMIRWMFKAVLNVELPNPFPRMPYETAMQRYGSDKPDLRIPLELTELSDLMAGVEFKLFSGPANNPHGRVAALRVPNGGKLSRREIDLYTEFVGRYGAKGLAYIKVNDAAAGREGLQAPIVKFLPDEVLTKILTRTGAENGDLLFFGADSAKVVNDALGALRIKLGQDLGLIHGEWAPLWVVNFPMFEWDEQDRRWNALHHPFTAPRTDDPAEVRANPERCLSRAYDMVLNGTEIGGGSVRIHRQEMQNTVFELLGIGPEEARAKFGFLLDALKFGCPPHGGLAFGLDRLVMLMVGATSIRDVMAFPKTQSAACLLTQAPAPVTEAQLRDLNIRLRRTP